jgi:hypothetical protein
MAKRNTGVLFSLGLAAALAFGCTPAGGSGNGNGADDGGSVSGIQEAGPDGGPDLDGGFSAESGPSVGGGPGAIDWNVDGGQVTLELLCASDHEDKALELAKIVHLSDARCASNGFLYDVDSTYGSDSHISWYYRQFDQRMSNPFVSFDQAKYAECKEKLCDPSCDRTVDYAPCDEIWTGTRSPGESCAEDGECVLGSFCTLLNGDQQCGVCDEVWSDGWLAVEEGYSEPPDNCYTSDAHRCSDTEYCYYEIEEGGEDIDPNTAECRTQPSLGEPCPVYSLFRRPPCQGDAYCDESSGNCVASPLNDESCMNSGGECAEGLFCDVNGDFTCKLLPILDEPCEWQCADGLVCDTTCKEPSILGAPCGGGCADDLVCDWQGDQTCKSLPQENESCISNQCASGLFCMMLGTFDDPESRCVNKTYGTQEGDPCTLDLINACGFEQTGLFCIGEIGNATCQHPTIVEEGDGCDTIVTGGNILLFLGSRICRNTFSTHYCDRAGPTLDGGPGDAEGVCRKRPVVGEPCNHNKPCNTLSAYCLMHPGENCVALGSDGDVCIDPWHFKSCEEGYFCNQNPGQIEGTCSQQLVYDDRWADPEQCVP